MNDLYTYYLKIYSYLLENNIYFCFDNGKAIFRKDCEKYFDELFAYTEEYLQEEKKVAY
jgi:hypothetical protein